MKELFKQYRVYFITLLIGSTLSLITYIATLVIRDTAWFKQETKLIEWYEKKKKSFAVGLRVDENKKLWYKAPDGETYRAILSESGSYYYYVNHEGKNKECH